jgi:hypothetical protein
MTLLYMYTRFYAICWMYWYRLQIKLDYKKKKCYFHIICSSVWGSYRVGLCTISSERLLDTADDDWLYKRFWKGKRRERHITIIYIRYVKPEAQGKEARANDQLKRGGRTKREGGGGRCKGWVLSHIWRVYEKQITFCPRKSVSCAFSWCYMNIGRATERPPHHK